MLRRVQCGALKYSFNQLQPLYVYPCLLFVYMFTIHAMVLIMYLHSSLCQALLIIVRYLEFWGSLFSLIVYWFPFPVTCPVFLLHINGVGFPPNKILNFIVLNARALAWPMLLFVCFLHHWMLSCKQFCSGCCCCRSLLTVLVYLSVSYSLFNSSSLSVSWSWRHFNLNGYVCCWATCASASATSKHSSRSPPLVASFLFRFWSQFSPSSFWDSMCVCVPGN